MEKIGIYIHIPFCTAKCSYCDFASFSATENLQRQYVTALKKEIAQRCGELHSLIKTDKSVKNIDNFDSGCCGDEKTKKSLANNGSKSKAECEKNDGELLVDTIFIGGGTPSALYRGGLSEIITELRKHVTFALDEFTVEANPESVTPEFVKECKRIGVNRISLGLQTAAPHLLKNLRRHTFSDFARAVEIIREQGIDSINADVMLGLPDQKNSDITDTLTRLVDMKIPHISAYSLKVEEGTPLFASGYRPDDDTSAEFYKIVCDLLLGTKHIVLGNEDKTSVNFVSNLAVSGNESVTNGENFKRNSAIKTAAQQKNNEKTDNYLRYEVSNFSKAGHECRHNQKYWTLQPYLGLGLSASSYYNEKRVTNTRDLAAYLKGDYVGFLEDARPNFLAEYIMLGLRTAGGISQKTLARHGLQIQNNTAFQKYLRSGILILDDDKITLSPDYYYVMNLVLSELI